MDLSITAQIAALRRMSVAELRGEWLRLYGEPTRSRNKQFLFRRLAWRVQELAYGGLTDHAKQRIEELAPSDFERACTPAQANPVADVAPVEPRSRSRRDPRLPTPGSVVTKSYKGRELRVAVRDDGFEFEGAMYGSLTALAKEITGCRSINGKLFFGLTQRKRS